MSDSLEGGQTFNPDDYINDKGLKFQLKGDIESLSREEVKISLQRANRSIGWGSQKAREMLVRIYNQKSREEYGDQFNPGTASGRTFSSNEIAPPQTRRTTLRRG